MNDIVFSNKSSVFEENRRVHWKTLRRFVLSSAFFVPTTLCLPLISLGGGIIASVLLPVSQASSGGVTCDIKGKNDGSDGGSSAANNTDVGCGINSSGNSLDGDGAVGFGNRAHATGHQSLALGVVVDLNGRYSIGIGSNVYIRADDAIAIGHYTRSGTPQLPPKIQSRWATNRIPCLTQQRSDIRRQPVVVKQALILLSFMRWL